MYACMYVYICIYIYMCMHECIPVCICYHVYFRDPAGKTKSISMEFVASLIILLFFTQ